MVLRDGNWYLFMIAWLILSGLLMKRKYVLGVGNQLVNLIWLVLIRLA
jgi:hypothetical protein